MKMTRTNSDVPVLNKEYRFNKEKHLHELFVDGEWKSLTGCTTVLSVLAKPALIQWAANMACDYIDDHFPTVEELMAKPTAIAELIKEARVAHRKKKEKAGDWGTEMHAWVETYIKAAMLGEQDKVPLPTDEMQKKGAESFIQWENTNNVKFLATEKNVMSEKMFTGGILDILCEIDGKRWIADIKTSSGIYFEAFWQMGGYDLMLQEMEPQQISGYIVLNLKKDGTFDERRSISNDDNKRGFLACLEIYRISEKIKNQII